MNTEKNGTREDLLYGVSGGIASHAVSKVKHAASEAGSDVKTAAEDAAGEVADLWNEDTTNKVLMVGVPVAGVVAYKVASGRRDKESHSNESAFQEPGFKAPDFKELDSKRSEWTVASSKESGHVPPSRSVDALGAPSTGVDRQPLSPAIADLYQVKLPSADQFRSALISVAHDRVIPERDWRAAADYLIQASNDRLDVHWKAEGNASRGLKYDKLDANGLLTTANRLRVFEDLIDDGYHLEGATPSDVLALRKAVDTLDANHAYLQQAAAKRDALDHKDTSPMDPREIAAQKVRPITSPDAELDQMNSPVPVKDRPITTSGDVQGDHEFHE